MILLGVSITLTIIVLGAMALVALWIKESHKLESQRANYKHQLDQQEQLFVERKIVYEIARDAGVDTKPALEGAQLIAREHQPGDSFRRRRDASDELIAEMDRDVRYSFLHRQRERDLYS
jgi:hypothetical protein